MSRCFRNCENLLFFCFLLLVAEVGVYFCQGTAPVLRDLRGCCMLARLALNEARRVAFIFFRIGAPAYCASIRRA